MAGVEMRLVDGSELKFNQSFLKFIVKKKNTVEELWSIWL